AWSGSCRECESTRDRRRRAVLLGGRKTMHGLEPELDAVEGGDGQLWGEVPAEFGAHDEAFEGGRGFETSESQRVFDEVNEMELAGALLEVSSEEELDRFLGNLIQRAGRAVGAAVRSPVGQSLVGMLKN